MRLVRLLAALILLVLLPLVACGYRPAVATRSIKGQSIAVEPLVNRTTTFEVEQTLTRALVRNLVEKSSYRVTPELSQADVILRGEILSVNATPVIYGRRLTEESGRETFGSAFLVTLNARVELRERQTDKVLFKNNNYLFREQYEINADVQNFFSELNPALERIANDFGASVVATILEDF
ncbi:MAG TPA: LPS assembly lipoprotein LptE [Acidobacteriota bacterium]|nr:LPS assembly lipoprotein LptE [Acidobacteriota bacterium]